MWFVVFILCASIAIIMWKIDKHDEEIHSLKKAVFNLDEYGDITSSFPKKKGKTIINL